MKPTFPLLVFAILFSTASFSQSMWTYFTPGDFAARRNKLMEQIGDGVALLQSAELPEAFIPFRQDNNFYYLSGVEIPGAFLIINGKTKKSILLVPDKIPGDIKKEAHIKAGEADAKQYGFDVMGSSSEIIAYLSMFAWGKQGIYIMASPEETTEMSRDRSMVTRISRMSNPLDGRPSKEAAMYQNIKRFEPSVDIKNLTPLLDKMRWVKDEKEIAVIRECGKIGAHGFDEAMRVTNPGMYEYQVVAACDFVYENEGAQGPSFFAIAASGEQGLTWHYNANNHKMKDGDVIILDYAPDFYYYSTDITRTWPVNGKFTEVQLKFYNCIKDAREKVIAAMKPGVTMGGLKAIAKEVYVKHGFEKYWLDYIGHFVGMAVHDVGSYDTPFVKGVVFNVEPIIEDKQMKMHFRLEDTIVITETGAENLTPATPVEAEEIYKLIKEKGIGEK